MQKCLAIRSAMLRACFLGLLLLLSTCSSRKLRHNAAPADQDEYFLKTHRLRSVAPKFTWPVKHVTPSSYFGWRGAARMHYGIDLRGPVGTRIYAAAAGKVISVQSRISGYGKMVIVDHGNNWSTLYAHLTRYRVVQGEWVKKGQLVGLMGKSGTATGVHLHFEIRHKADPVDPMLFLPKNNRN